MTSIWSSTEWLYDWMVLQMSSSILLFLFLVLGLKRIVFFFKALVEVLESDAKEVLGCAFHYNNKDKRPSFLPVN